MKKIIAEIEGAVVELENYQSLMDVLYCYGSDKVASVLKSAIAKADVPTQPGIELGDCCDTTNISDVDMLKLLHNAFSDLRETPMVILETN